MADAKIWALTMASDQHETDHYLVEIGDCSICMPTQKAIGAYAALRHRHAGGAKANTVPEELELRLTPGELNLDRFKKVKKENVAKREKKGEKDTFTWEEYLEAVGAQKLKSKFPENKILSLLK